MRLSSPAMAAAAIRGAADGGADVLDLGMVGTEMVYFAVGDLELDGGIEVTASHNPKEYTGMKIVRRGALPVGGDSGLMEVRDRALAGFGESDRARRGVGVRHLAGLRRARAVVRGRRRDPAAAGRHRRGERDGGRDAPARPRAASDRRRARTSSSPTAASRTTSRTHCCPRTASSSSRRRARRAPTSGSRSTATPTAASSSTTPASSCPATS